MKKLTVLAFSFACLSPLFLTAQISFSKQTALLPPGNHYSGVAIAITDMNGDGLDDIVRMNKGLSIAIEYQTGANQPFGHLDLGSVGTENAWGMCVADVDNNNYGDIMSGGYYDGVKIHKANSDGTQYAMTKLLNPSTFVQGVNFADINNDGWLDAFVCHDDGVARIFGNNGDGTFTYQPNWMDLATSPASDNSGNYGSVWSDIDNDGDLDLYIAKCRQSVNDPTDPRRINQLFLNNGDGTYTQDIANASGLRIGAQSWTADFGDIDNDGDFDCFVTNHDVSSQLLENDGFGHFTDITAQAGIFNQVGGVIIQGVFTDFDNDGLVDILVAGSSDYLLHNNGNKTFSFVSNAFDANEIESYALGDLNNDGYVDVYAGYANTFNTPSSNKPDALWMNTGSGKNYIGFRLRGVQSNRDGVGAKIVVYSALGKQTREVHSGQSYGISNSLQVHFGLNHDDIVDSVLVHWPSGKIDRLDNALPNQYIVVNEGGCILNAISLLADGPTTFCSGQSLALMAPAGFASYLWSNGATTQNILVSNAGNFSVVVTDSIGCQVSSAPISTTVDPVQIPNIVAASDTIFCTGSSVLLEASEATSYLWSNGETTKSIIANQSGNYWVKAQGLCEIFQSSPISITVLESPSPVAIGDTVAIGSTASLSIATGTPFWYAAANDPNVLSNDNPLILPGVTEKDTFWVSTVAVYDQPNAHVGMANHQGGATSDNSYNGGIVFDAYKAFTLENVKLYTTVAGSRKINLLNAAGLLLNSVTVNVPTGTNVIDLKLDVPVGQNMLLTTDSEHNLATIGTAGPQLRRSNQGVSYPYTLDGIVQMKNSTFDSTRYYYFFDWEVNVNGYSCESPRVPVIVYVDSSLVAAQEPKWGAALKVFPNPTTGLLNIENSNFSGGNVLFQIKNAQGALIRSAADTFTPGLLRWKTDLSGLPAGAYWLEMQTDQGIVRRKLIVS